MEFGDYIVKPDDITQMVRRNIGEQSRDWDVSGLDDTQLRSLIGAIGVSRDILDKRFNQMAHELNTRGVKWQTRRTRL